MSKSTSKIARHPVEPGVRTRREKLTLAVSATAFFAAIGVVGWFGLSGFDTSEEQSDGGARIIYAGGAPDLVVDAGEAAVAEGKDAPDEGDFVGEFGDPVSELYARDDDGGWGETALETAR